MTWRHPRSKDWHQLDLILTRRTQLKNLLVTRTYHSADCDPGHSLVYCRVGSQPKKFYRTKHEGKSRIDVSNTKHSDCLAEFKTPFSSCFVGHYNLFSTEQWRNVKNATHSATFKRPREEEKNSTERLVRLKLCKTRPSH